MKKKIYIYIIGSKGVGEIEVGASRTKRIFDRREGVWREKYVA